MYLQIKLHEHLRQLPLVLCGPILRRVTPESVTVWVALHSGCSVKLEIRDAAGKVFESNFTDTIKIGLNLHLACITAEANTPAETLVWNKLYYYNLHFYLGGQPLSLQDAGVCSFTLQSFKDDFCYGNDYPGFILPPDSANLSSLRIVHGSCRKPHGAGMDALGCLDILIRDNYQNPSKRPQLLCLTGDQIYADEVDDTLITIVDEIAKKIVSPSTGTIDGDRQGIIKNIKFTSTAAKNHLLSFSEFVSMYLLVWSDVLWPLALDISKVSDELQCFKSSLKAVRRALANIPTYMVFDDHEITDDWNRQKSWRESTYSQDFINGGNPAAPNISKWPAHAIIANGLLAFALFQGWGNLGVQEQNIMYPYKNIINKCPRGHLNLAPSLAEDAVKLFTLQRLMLPRATPITKPNGSKWIYLEYTAGMMPWSFRVDYPGLQIIGLDSRNLRGYKSGNDAPAVIYPENIVPQLGNDYAKPLTIVMCGAPIFGVEAIEAVQGKSNLVRFGEFRGDNYIDKEAWCFDIDAFYSIQVELAKFKKVIVLSGDVHFGFSAQVQFWDDSDSKNPQSAIIAQCCSSALKNKNDWKLILYKIGRILSVPKEKVWLKRLNSEPWIVDKEEVEKMTPPVVKHQQLRLKLLYDNDLTPGLGNVVINSYPPPFNIPVLFSIELLKKLNSGLIANSNIGMIHFSWPYLLHELITPLPDDPHNLTQTIATHTIDFQIPSLIDKPLK